MRRLQYLVVSCVLLSGCFGPGEGVEVPQDQIYFPVGLALHGEPGEKPGHLLVVSSDFDLQYNGGAVQSYNLDRLEGADGVLPQRCSDDGACGSGICEAGLCVAGSGESPCPQGDRADADRLLYPGRCNAIDPRTLQAGTVKIGAFATDAIIRSSPAGDAQRLFVPVRGDSTLHWLDVNGDGTLSCGQGSDGACDEKHRVGDDTSESTRNIKLGPEPFAIDATEHAENIVVTNQTSGTATLFVNDQSAWSAGVGPTLQFAFSPNTTLDPVGVAALPLTAAESRQAQEASVTNGVALPNYTFMMTFRNSAQVRLFRSTPDDQSSISRPYLVDGGGVPIAANSVGSDSRGIAVDGSARQDAEAACFEDEACLAQAALVPLDVYVANRAPSSLLIGRTQPPQQYPYFFQTLPLTTGPSRVVVAKIHAANGELETRVFVVCFESRRIFVYDPKRARIETEILTGRGPHALAVDTERRLLYVGHFTDSYIGVFSLDLALPDTYGTMLATLGEPKTPRSSK
jgi:hypothetical protein